MRNREWIMIGAIAMAAVALSVGLGSRWRGEPGEEWREVERQLHALRTEMQVLRERLDAEFVFHQDDDQGVRGERMERAMEMLGGSDPVARYRAGRTLRGYGEDAIEPLVDTIRRGEGGSGHAFVLTSIGGDHAADAMRELSQDLLVRGGDSGTVAMLLGELARRRDLQAAGLFREALRAGSDSVRLAAVSGIRRLGDTEALDALIRARRDAGRLSARELDRTIHGLLTVDPEGFRSQAEALEPLARFDLVRLMLMHPGGAQRRLLTHWADADPDPRVMSAARRALELLEQRAAGAGPAPDETTGSGIDLEAVEEWLDRLRD